MALADAFDNIQEMVDGLNQRERRLMTAMAVVLVVVLLFVPIYLGVASVGELEDENQAITGVLQEISQKEGDLIAQRADRREREMLYDRRTPSLGSFLEEQAQQRELDGLEVTDQPEFTMGSFTRRSVRASLPRIDIKPFVYMLAEIKNSSYPVSIDSIQLAGGRDDFVYSAKFGIQAYDQPTSGAGLPGAPGENATGEEE